MSETNDYVYVGEITAEEAPVYITKEKYESLLPEQQLNYKETK